MCLIVFALDALPGCRLLVAANRDEHLDRPTQPLHAWRLDNGTPVVAGRDLHAGGTWLGVTPAGRVAMLTNVREALVGNAPQSRGELVTGWLQGDQPWPDFAQGIAAERYSGFNLVLGDLRRGEWVWLSNRPADGATQLAPGLVSRMLPPGVYGLSNAALDTPWPKTLRLKQAMHSVVDRAETQLPPDWRQPLLATLLDRRQAPVEALPHTGAPRVWEQALSSPFVDYADRRYGTRSSLLLQAGDDEVVMEEWSHERGDGAAPTLAAPATPTADGRWPLARSTYRRMCISMWGMPASSNGSPLTA